jgi:hypothetical protein
MLLAAPHKAPRVEWITQPPRGDLPHVLLLTFCTSAPVRLRNVGPDNRLFRERTTTMLCPFQLALPDILHMATSPAVLMPAKRTSTKWLFSTSWCRSSILVQPEICEVHYAYTTGIVLRSLSCRPSALPGCLHTTLTKPLYSSFRLQYLSLRFHTVCSWLFWSRRLSDYFYHYGCQHIPTLTYFLLTNHLTLRLLYCPLTFHSNYTTTTHFNFNQHAIRLTTLVIKPYHCSTTTNHYIKRLLHYVLRLH